MASTRLVIRRHVEVLVEGAGYIARFASPSAPPEP
jgi:hypothetical protein